MTQVAQEQKPQPGKKEAVIFKLQEFVEKLKEGKYDVMGGKSKGELCVLELKSDLYDFVDDLEV